LTFHGNHTTVTEFILHGLTDRPELQLPLFMLFLVIYIVTLLWNLGLIALFRRDSRFHTPMYYFVSHLAFVDICYSSAITPKLLAELLAEEKSIAFAGCAAQLCAFAVFGNTECLILAVMAYDRYTAICNPLNYLIIMSKQTCAQLVAGCYVLGILHSVTHTTFTFTLSFCGSNEINHYFCDVPPLLEISCSDTHTYEMVLFALVCINCVSTTMAIFISYCYILASILRMRSAEGRRKTFSTCASHLTSVTIFYGTIFFMYLRPSSTYSLDQDKVASVFYTVVIPMLNPLIYSLRNKEVKDALRKVIMKKP
uniref:Olfactory receptor n=1 Tax=Sphenodon punctatus TaxID=8508 RepID=A0A8D0HJ85_SPHPU